MSKSMRLYSQAQAAGYSCVAVTHAHSGC